MTYSDVKTKYGKDILKEYWGHIVSVAASCGKESEVAKDVSKFRNSLIEYARCKSWPPSNIDCYSPNYLTMKFFTRKYADSNFYLGAGMAFKGLIETVHDDIKAGITKACLTNPEEHNEEEKVFLIGSENTVVDYLSPHIGETLTQEETAEQTGTGLTRLRAVLAELKDAGLLVMENRVIVPIDANMAKKDMKIQVSW